MRWTASLRKSAGSTGLLDISHRYSPSCVARISQPCSGRWSSTQYSLLTRPPKKLILNLALEASTTRALAFHSASGPSGFPLWQLWITEKPSVVRVHSRPPAWQPRSMVLGERATSYQRPAMLVSSTWGTACTGAAGRCGSAEAACAPASRAVAARDAIRRWNMGPLLTRRSLSLKVRAWRFGRRIGTHRYVGRLTGDSTTQGERTHGKDENFPGVALRSTTRPRWAPAAP